MSCCIRKNGNIDEDPGQETPCAAYFTKKNKTYQFDNSSVEHVPEVISTLLDKTHRYNNKIFKFLTNASVMCGYFVKRFLFLIPVKNVT